MGFFLLLFPFIFWQVEASTVRIANSEAPVAFASNTSSNISLRLVTDKSRSDATAETDPVIVYFPVGGDQAGWRNRSTVADSSLLPYNPSLGNGYALAQIRLTNDTGNTQYLKAAVKTNAGFQTLALQSPYSLAANTSVTVDSAFNLVDMCLVANIDCSNIKKATADATPNSGTYIIYYFLHNQNIAANQTIDPTQGDYTGGFYVKYMISDQRPTGNVTINKVYNGDGRVFLDFSGGETVSIDKIYKTMILKHTGIEAQGSTTVGAVGVSNIHSLLPPTLNGLLDVQNLTNNTDYYFSVSLVNKFLFHSPLSTSVYARPEPIEALLQKQACFLLTAGFAGNHPVVEYFRHIRDDYLLSFSLGKSFVNSYYAWAPQYAQSILDRPWLSAMIRALAHSLYFILNQTVLFAIIVGLSIFAGVFLRKRGKGTA